MIASNEAQIYCSHQNRIMLKGTEDHDCRFYLVDITKMHQWTRMRIKILWGKWIFPLPFVQDSHWTVCIMILWKLYCQFIHFTNVVFVAFKLYDNFVFLLFHIWPLCRNNPLHMSRQRRCHAILKNTSRFKCNLVAGHSRVVVFYIALFTHVETRMQTD